MDTLWRIEMLGGLRVIGGEQTHTRFRTQKTGALLAYLAFYQERSHAREHLIQLLWPDAEFESGRHNLRNALSALRQQLEPTSALTGRILHTDRLSVQLNSQTFATDVAAFEAALATASRSISKTQKK